MLIAVFGGKGVGKSTFIQNSLVCIKNLLFPTFLSFTAFFLSASLLSFFFPPPSPQGHYERKSEAGDQFYITGSVGMCGRDVPVKIVRSLVHIMHTCTNVVTSSLSCIAMICVEGRGREGRREREEGMREGEGGGREGDAAFIACHIIP